MSNEVVTYSVKLDNETRNQLSRLIEQSGMTAKDFIAQLVKTHELNKARESMGLVKELESLQHHLARIEEIFVAQVKAANDRAEGDSKLIERAQEENQKIKADAHDLRQEKERIVKEAEEQVKKAEAQTALVKENAEKEIARTKEELQRAIESKEQSVQMANLAQKAATQAEDKLKDIEAKALQADQLRVKLAELENLNERLVLQVGQAEADVEKAKADAKRLLEDTAAKAELDKERAVLEAQRESMIEIRELRNALAEAREALAETKASLEICNSQGNILNKKSTGSKK